jgi:hypothetical protein
MHHVVNSVYQLPGLQNLHFMRNIPGFVSKGVMENLAFGLATINP